MTLGPIPETTSVLNHKYRTYRPMSHEQVKAVRARIPGDPDRKTPYRMGSI